MISNGSICVVRRDINDFLKEGDTVQVFMSPTHSSENASFMVLNIDRVVVQIDVFDLIDTELSIYR